MSTDNLNTLSMTPEDKAALGQATATLAGLATKYSVNIPAEQKKQYAVIGTGRAGMDEVFLRSLTDNPNLVPSYVVMADVNLDRGFRKDIKDVVAPIQAIVEGLLDAETLANSDNYMAYLAYYNNVKMAAKRGVPGADTVLTKLASFFPTGRRTTATPKQQ
jgi:hypothetical protein